MNDISGHWISPDEHEAAREAIRDEQYHERLGALVGLHPDSDLLLPHVHALYTASGEVLCRWCAPHAGAGAIRVNQLAHVPCARCGLRVDGLDR